MSDRGITDIFRPLYEHFIKQRSYPSVNPLLAHYTSVEGLKGILQSDEVWFSNPLSMNDWNELVPPMQEAVTLFKAHIAIENACNSKNRAAKFRESLEVKYRTFLDEEFDIYVFCLSQHDLENYDGKLSMWRGYGNNGNGAAIVIDTSRIHFVDSSPLILAKVEL
jgi:hypothetical protein